MWTVTAHANDLRSTTLQRSQDWFLGFIFAEILCCLIQIRNSKPWHWLLISHDCGTLKRSFKHVNKVNRSSVFKRGLKMVKTRVSIFVHYQRFWLHFYGDTGVILVYTFIIYTDFNHMPSNTTRLWSWVRTLTSFFIKCLWFFTCPHSSVMCVSDKLTVWAGAWIVQYALTEINTAVNALQHFPYTLRHID